MPRRIENEINEGIEESAEERSIADMEAEQTKFEEEFGKNNGLLFIWVGETSNSNNVQVLEKAFTLANRKEFWDKYKLWGIADIYYISDLPATGKGDSRELGNKYTDERRFLIANNKYYLNQI